MLKTQQSEPRDVTPASGCDGDVTEINSMLIANLETRVCLNH